MSSLTTINAPGGCLCGAVRYRVSGAVMESGYCHCRSCQRQSGAPVVAWFTVAPTDFVYEKGAPGAYRASDHASREFCKNCGAYLVFREDDPREMISVNTVTLDDPALSPPTVHIYCESRIGWFDTRDALPRYERGKSS
ncbi:MAG: GFA family protein [Parvularculaceae bacterium]